MKRKGGKRAELRPLAEVIARDNRNKRALDRQFWSFYKQMKKAIRFNAELKELEVPLERVRESVQLCAFGIFLGIPMVEVKKPTNWEG